MTVVKIQTSRRELKKQATRQQILSAAARLFGRRGLGAVTVEEIAEAADVGKGTIYNYFATKEDIVVAFVVDIEHRLQEHAAKLARAETPLEETLTEFVLYHLRAKEPYHAFVRVFLSRLVTADDAFRGQANEIQAATDPPLRLLFEGLRERGLIRPELSAPELTGVFKALQLGVTSVWAIEGPPWERAYNLARRSVRYFCEGIRR